MNKVNSKYSSPDNHTFNKLSRLYVIALSAIALSVIISQIVINIFLNNQQDDSRVINVAGRQRMLSQKLIKEILLISSESHLGNRNKIKNDLQKTLKLWSSSHQALQTGNDSLGLPGKNSEVVSKMFSEIDPLYNTIYNTAQNVLKTISKEPNATITSFEKDISILNNTEPKFLTLMDYIVNQYDLEASKKVSKLRTLEFFILIISLLILIAEFFLIFRPAAFAVRNTMQKLLSAEKNAKKMAVDADKLSEAKEKSVKELRVLNYAMDQTLLFARVTRDGVIVDMGDKFSKLFDYQRFNMNEKFSDIVTKSDTEKVFIDDLISDNYKKGWQGEIKVTKNESVSIWLEMSMIPVSLENEKSELLIICFDITRRKEAQLEIERLTKESFEEKINQQKILSSKIIENQENEQNRIAKDIHDGIGQMLTGLKYNIESIDLKDKEKSALKIEQIKGLTLDIIKGVRTATFNLTPPELTDHGIVPGLTKLTQELSRFTGKKIIFFNKTDFNDRLESLVEINVYRIVQEAINNALKYADSSHIIVTLSHSKKMLSIIIDDNGKGFEAEKVKKNKNGGGMGMTYMKERIKYINGRLFMNSSPNEGTRITLNIPF